MSTARTLFNIVLRLVERQGKKIFALQTLPPIYDDNSDGELVSKQAGFSLHAGVATKAHQRKKLERLCRYPGRRLQNRVCH